jgi:hypothetical protein
MPRARRRLVALSAMARSVAPLHSRTMTPESQKPDLRPQLRELIKWYDEALGHIAAGAIVEPGEPERLKEEQGLTARLLEFLEADERGKLD